MSYFMAIFSVFLPDNSKCLRDPNPTPSTGGGGGGGGVVGRGGQIKFGWNEELFCLISSFQTYAVGGVGG